MKDYVHCPYLFLAPHIWKNCTRTQILYTLQLIPKLPLGSNNVDNCSRIQVTEPPSPLTSIGEAGFNVTEHVWETTSSMDLVAESSQLGVLVTKDY